MTLYDTRNPSRRGTLIEWIRPKDDEAFAVVKFPGSLTPERIPEHRVCIVGDTLNGRHMIALREHGITVTELYRRAEACGLSLKDAAEALCE